MPRTVLIVDDDQAILDLLSDYCRESGYAVIRAADGRSGLELARLHQPSLIITDLMMPLMDGAALIAALREDPLLYNVTTVLLSAASRTQLQGVAADIVVPKPFDLDDIDKVLHLLDALPEQPKSVNNNDTTVALASGMCYDQG